MPLERFLEETMKSRWWIGKTIWATDYCWDYVSFSRKKKRKNPTKMMQQLWETKKISFS